MDCFRGMLCSTVSWASILFSNILIRTLTVTFTNGNVTVKVHKTNAAIWCDEMCRMIQLMPKYIHIKVHGNNEHSRNTVYVQ